MAAVESYSDFEAELLRVENDKLEREIEEITKNFTVNETTSMPSPTARSEATASTSADMKLDTTNIGFQHIGDNREKISESKLLRLEKPDLEEIEKRLIGEIAFQLDRRILQCVFSHRKRLYGFTVRNIEEKITEYTTNVKDATIDEDKRELLSSRYKATMDLLRHTAGYNPKYHPIFSEMIVNSFGVLDGKSKIQINLKENMDADHLKSLILKNLDPQYTYDAIIILNALLTIAEVDGKGLFL